VESSHANQHDQGIWTGSKAPEKRTHNPNPETKQTSRIPQKPPSYLFDIMHWQTGRTNDQYTVRGGGGGLINTQVVHF
jgi:hypothetical protein